ncbi:anti-sigma factor antagonist [Nocardia abscessus]|uniref:anti-sigma factor antagonist n=1 Tax=Nocardia abscessus TaxID=120957 RepID=UPI00189639B7|nr:anti-sigma factor antagonist [Nocardia abscessus]MBF6340972.1 anti-sigma factor antagonist [Nocardia abscessus]
MSTALPGLAASRPPPADEPEDARLRLTATIERHGGAIVVHAHGEVDAYTLPTWRRLLSEAVAAASAGDPLVIDTSDILFMACRSLLVLAEESEKCLRHGSRLSVVGSRTVVGRVVTALELDALLPVYSCVEDAVAESAPSGRSHVAGRCTAVAPVRHRDDPSA